MSSEIKDSAIRGGVAKIVSQGFNFVLRMGSLMVLGRLLDPASFGLIGMVTALTGVLNLFREFGLSTAVIQREDVTEEQLSTIFWINIAVGFLLGGITAISAPIIASFYHEPRLVPVTLILATGFVFNAVGIQHSAIMQRGMRFSALSVIDFVGQLASAVVGVGMALAGYGYWALAFMNIALPLVQSAALWMASGWTPGWPRGSKGIVSMMRYGGTVTLNGFVVYVAYNLEKVLLGRYWGAEVIGLYGRAYQLVNIPMENLNAAVSGVAFSALSRLQNDKETLKGYFLKGYSLLLALTVPITIGCALTANDLIGVVLGPKWASVVPIFQLLTPTILVLAIINPLVWMMWADGKTARSLHMAFVLAPVVLTGYLIGLPYGPQGVAIGYSGAMLVWMVPHVLWSVHGTAISAWDVFSTLSKPLLSISVAAVTLLGIRSGLDFHAAPVVRLSFESVVLGVVYLVVLLFGLKQWELFEGILKGLFRRTSVTEPATQGEA